MIPAPRSADLCPRCGRTLPVAVASPCRTCDPRSEAAPMLDPSWTPAKGYGHALAILATLERKGERTMRTATMEEREVAAEIQERLSGARNGLSDEMHRVVRATGGGWVEIQAEFLIHVLEHLCLATLERKENGQ